MQVYKLSDLLSDVVSILENGAKEKNLDFCFRIEEDMPKTFVGDADRIKQILIHLAENALRYTAKGRITFRICGRCSDKGQFYLRISMADTGIGMQEEERRRLFETGRNAKKEMPKWSTLRKWVEELDGEITVESVYEKGTIVMLLIPQKEAEAQCEAAQSQTEMQIAIKEETEARAEQADMTVFHKEKAMVYCAGSEEMYQMMLGAYCDSGKKYSQTLPEAVEKKDWDSYRIIVHAIKSTSLSIGAEALSAYAKEQEMLAKELKIEEILASYEDFFAAYQKVLAQAAMLCREKEEKEEVQEEKRQVSKEEYRNVCLQLCETVDNFEMGEAEKQLALLKQMTTIDLPDNIEEILQKAETAIEEFEYDNASVLLQELIKTIQ